ncbi:MAG: hypothetical protein JRJ70_15635 [Deltaproteobacteria bacterium]|nr:hypothetical protein [Deltaproteobacteria bacterium]MBW2105772.1 hypothetical protein [Deltaproteobacteria bacterium]
MPKPKIDRVKLNQLLKAGKSQREVAQVFDVTEGAISKAKKELNLAVVKNVTLESAHKVVDKNLDAVAQLQKINTYANELLDLVMRWQRGDKEALRILESQVKEVKKVGKGKDVEFVKEYRMKDPREIALRAMAEIRGQLNLQLDIFKTLYDLEAVQEFQKEVLETIGEVDQYVRREIIERLKEKRAVRSITRFT